MQKKIIALAVAGLVSGAAFAQSNVTVYGTVDMAYVYQGSAVQDNLKSMSALNDGGWDSSRFGLMGSEDLGNGLSANFKQEYGTNLDTKDNGGDTGVRIRNSYVSLASKSWGEVKLGSFGTVHDDYAGWSEAGGMSWGHGPIDLIVSGDAYNAVEYISPSMSGLQFKLGYSTNYQNTQDASDQNLRAGFVSAAYANGPLQIALTYDNVNQQSTDAKKDEWMISGGYDFGVVKLGLGYDQTSATNDGGVKVDRDALRVVLGVPVGPRVDLALSYSQTDLDISSDNKDYDNSAWGVSAVYKLSKRTNLYAAGYVADAEHGMLLDVSSGDAPEVGFYETAFKVGVRHQF